MRFRTSRLMVAAVLLWAAQGASVALGLADWVGLLSGTPLPGVDVRLAALGAGFHVLSWFGAVLVAPVLVIAAALLELGRRARWRAGASATRSRGASRAP